MYGKVYGTLNWTVVYLRPVCMPAWGVLAGLGLSPILLTNNNNFCDFGYRYLVLA